MRESSPSQITTTDPLNGLRPERKFLLRSISTASRCESKFYPGPSRRHIPKLLRIHTLANSAGKMRAARVFDFEAKSLFHNILAVSPFDARIYTDAPRSKPGKSLRMNILRNRHEKKCVACSTGKIPPRPTPSAPPTADFCETGHFTL